MLGLLSQNIQIAQQSIKGQLLRTILTVLIIAIGITALVGILSAVNVLDNTISDGFSGIGANTFSIRRTAFNFERSGNARKRRNPQITYREAQEFIAQYQFPGSQTAVSFQATSNAEIKSEDRKTKPKVIVTGVNEHYVVNSGIKLQEGRDFTSLDIKNKTAVCLIGKDMEDALFQGLNPIGQTLSVRGNKFTVIGLLEEKGSTFGNNIDLRVLIPIAAARNIYSGGAITYEMSVKVLDKEFMNAALDQATVLLRSIRGLSPTEDNNFGIIQSDELLNVANEQKAALYIASFVISGITILGSSIALMNIMLVSVTERTREIGVRKALGAKKSTISMQFFIETFLISQYGSILGILLGIAIGYAVAVGFEASFETPWAAIILATIVSIIIAIFSGLYPAIKAARLDPIESLRYE